MARDRHMSEKRSAVLDAGAVRSGAMWSAANTIFVKLVTIAITAIVLRIVTPREFGVFAVAATVYAIVSSFSDFGLGSCLQRRDFDPRKIGPTVVALALVTTTSLGIATMMMAGPLATVMGAPDAAGAVRVLALSIILNGVFTAPTALAARDFRQRLVFSSSLVGFVPANASLVLLAVHGDGTMAFAWSRVIGQLCSGAFLAWQLRAFVRPNIDRSQLKMILRFGVPLAGANLINFTFLNLDYIFVGHRMGPIVLGVYMLAFNTASWATSVLSSTVNTVAMPAFSQVGKDETALRSALATAARSVGLVAFPISALTIALAGPLITTVYGRQWTAAVPVLQILGAYGALFVISLLFANLLVGTGRTAVLMAVQAGWLILLLPAMWAGAAWDGLRGVATAHVVVVTVAILPAYMILIRRIAPGGPVAMLHALKGPLMAAIVAGVIARLTEIVISQNIVALLVGGLAGGLCYLVLSWGAILEQVTAGGLKILHHKSRHGSVPRVG
ncbi:oligosaccharide flippase family protein [Microlunatus elymi]|nr:oligosaccharide flippase family protein [Microlunatus elymi]